MCKAGLVYATASEDMDSLTFGTPRLIRQLWSGATAASEKKGIRPMEFDLTIALEVSIMANPTSIESEIKTHTHMFTFVGCWPLPGTILLCSYA